MSIEKPRAPGGAPERAEALGRIREQMSRLMAQLQDPGISPEQLRWVSEMLDYQQRTLQSVPQAARETASPFQQQIKPVTGKERIRSNELPALKIEHQESIAAAIKAAEAALHELRSRNRPDLVRMIDIYMNNESLPEYLQKISEKLGRLDLNKATAGTMESFFHMRGASLYHRVISLGAALDAYYADSDLPAVKNLAAALREVIDSAQAMASHPKFNVPFIIPKLLDEMPFEDCEITPIAKIRPKNAPPEMLNRIRRYENTPESRSCFENDRGCLTELIYAGYKSNGKTAKLPSGAFHSFAEWQS